MELSALHMAVRSYVRNGSETMPKSVTERAAVKAWKRHLRGIEGDVTRVMPSSRASEWAISPEPYAQCM